MHAYIGTHRVMPDVPGINGSKLKPSIGCDFHRTSLSQKVRASSQLRKARPMSGQGIEELRPLSGRVRRPKAMRAYKPADGSQAANRAAESFGYAEALAAI